LNVGDVGEINFLFFSIAMASEFFETAHTNSCKILVTFLHAKIYDLSETSEILNRSCKFFVRIVQRVTEKNLMRKLSACKHTKYCKSF
jgi:hypothetical protein